jgi:hypothetical protein
VGGRRREYMGTQWGSAVQTQLRAEAQILVKYEYGMTTGRVKTRGV